MYVNDSEDSQHLSEKISKYLSKGYAIIYAAESNPIKAALLGKLNIDSENYKENNLSVISSEKLFYPKQKKFNIKEIADQIQSLIHKAKEKSGCKKTLLIGNTHPLFEKGHLDELLNFENWIIKNMPVPIEIVCCYNANTLLELPFHKLVIILLSHNCSIHQNHDCYEWNNKNIINLISKGLNKAHGNDAAILLMKTLKLIYHIDEERIISEPKFFEDTIRDVLGNSGDITMRAITNEIIKELVFETN